jgi:NAD(P)H-flavin reductase
VSAEPIRLRRRADQQRDGSDDSRAGQDVAVVQQSWAHVQPHADDLAKYFYGLLFHLAPETRDLFPANMQVQRSRLLRAVVHVVQTVDRPEQVAPFLSQLGRDHRKFGVLAGHYTALGTALIGAVRHYSGTSWTPEIERAWTRAFDFVTDLMSRAADADTGPASWLGRVTGHHRLTWDVAVIQVRTGSPIPYRPGQYLSVETPRRPRLWRYLSPANPPNDEGEIEFHVRAVADGWVSRAIVAHTRCGDTWRIGAPMGRMTPQHRNDHPLLLVAGGTGVAPFTAIVTDMARRGIARRTELFIGGGTWADLYDLPRLRQLSYELPWLNVIPVLEREAPGSGAEIGTLAEIVTRYGAWTDHDVFVSGSPDMIRTTISKMLVAGTPLDNIHYDPFFID